MAAENFKSLLIAVLILLVSFLGVTCIELQKQIQSAPQKPSVISVIANNRAQGNLYILSAPRPKPHWDTDPLPKAGGNG